MNATLAIPEEEMRAFCEKWKIAELAVFGSALREDFGQESDLDLLVRFSPDADWSLFDHLRMEMELRGILGREVDLVSRRAIERSANPIRREAILGSAVVLYAA
jgi:uncharacterized protein